MEPRNNQFVLSPTYNIPALMVKLLVICLGIIVLFSGGIVDEKNPILCIMVIFSIVFGIGLVTILPFRLRSYAKQTFTIGETHLSESNSFLGYSRKDLPYSEVREVQLGQTFLQNLFGLGNIYIFTNAFGEGAGLCFFDLKNSEEIYNEIQKRVAAAKAAAKEAERKNK